MNAQLIVSLWLSGDLPMRPRYIAKEAALRAALRDPVRAAEAVAILNDGSRSLTCGPTFAANMAEYRRVPDLWRIHERTRWRTQYAIDNCLRGSGGVLAIPTAGAGAAWGIAR